MSDQPSSSGRMYAARTLPAPRQPPIATWDSARDVWIPETERHAMIPTSGRSGVYSETFPTSGMTLSGAAYALPTWEPATAASASSSSPGLPTPSANLETNGGSQDPEKRRAGGHQPTTADVVEHL